MCLIDAIFNGTVIRKKGNDVHCLPWNKYVLLFSQFELLNDCSVALNVFLFEICEQFFALANEVHERFLSACIFLVFAQMLGQVIDPMGEKGDLSFWRTRVGIRLPVFFEDFAFLFRSQVHTEVLLITTLFSFKGCKDTQLIPSLHIYLAGETQRR